MLPSFTFIEIVVKQNVVLNYPANRQREYLKFYSVEHVIFELTPNFRIYFERKHVAARGENYQLDHGS